MSMAAASVDRRLNWPVLIGLYAVAVAILLVRMATNHATTPLLADADDAMRLVVVRDFLRGQNWYDLVQHRLNVPFGAEVHWSRLIDAPLAGAIYLLSPLGQGLSETLVVSAWPLLLLFVVLLLSAKICVQLLDREATLPGALLPTLSPAVMAEFMPGRIDHHGVQIVLLLLLVWASIGAVARPRLAIVAGIAAATAIAIGTEGLPGAIAAVVGFFGLFVFDARSRQALRLFGLSFGGAAVVHLAIALPPSRWLVPACDAISIVYVAAAVLVGLGFVLLSLLPIERAGPVGRMVTGLIIGVPLLGALYVAFPVCFSGPYAGLDPWLVSHWLDRVTEAKPLFESLFEIPDYAFAVALPVVAALIVLVVRVVRVKDDRLAWSMLLVFLAVATAIMLVQVRGARLATLLAVPAGALLIQQVRDAYLRTGRAKWALALAGSWLLFSGIVISLVAGAIGSRLAGQRGAAVSVAAPIPTRNECLLPEAFATLAALPEQRIMNFIDLGSHILLNTAHEVVAAPYHRDQAGVLDAIKVFNGPQDEARAILAQRGATLLVLCAGLPEMRGTPDAETSSLLKAIASGQPPAWLTPLSASGQPVQIYRIEP